MTFRPLQETQLSLSNLQDEINRLFGRIWHAGVSTGPFDGQKWAPFVDLYEYDDRYTLYAEVPGVEGNEVDLSHIGHALTIRGEKVRPVATDEDKRPIHSERRFGAFSRTIDLPADVDPDRMSARCHAGVLEITIPKSAASRPKAIKIDVAGD
jgi:HSP20 family protein